MTFRRSGVIERVGGDELDPAQDEIVSGPWNFTGGLKERGVTVPTSLGERLRRAAARAYKKNSIDLGVMASPPTITTGTSNQDATLTKSYRTSVEGHGYFYISGGIATQGIGGFAPYLGFPVVSTPSGSGGNAGGLPSKNAYQFAVEFMTDAPKVMLRYASSTNVYMVEVDDQPVSATGLAYPSTGGTGYTLLDFTSVGGAAIRKIRMELSQAPLFDGVYVGPTYTVWKPSDENDVRVAVVGDSIEDGNGSSLPSAGWSKVAGKLLGWSDVRQVAFAGTGFVNAGSFNTFGAALRVSDAVANNPDVLIIAASQNDDASVASVPAAALAAFQAYRAALPNVPIIVLGADAGSSGPSAGRLSNEAAVLSAFNTWADGNSHFIPVSNAADGSWFTGTGYVGATTGTGNRDRYGYDASHPNNAGHLVRARRFESAFKRLVLPNIR
jgi:hypothetical protein